MECMSGTSRCPFRLNLVVDLERVGDVSSSQFLRVDHVKRVYHCP